LEITKSLFTSDLFIQPGKNKPVLSEELSELMIKLFRCAGIFASEKPVRNTTKRLEDLSPNMVYPIDGSCIDNSLFTKYTEAIMKNDFAYSGILLGQKLELIIPC
jgi:hypothetical protein